MPGDSIASQHQQTLQHAGCSLLRRLARGKRHMPLLPSHRDVTALKCQKRMKMEGGCRWCPWGGTAPAWPMWHPAPFLPPAPHSQLDKSSCRKVYLRASSTAYEQNAQHPLVLKFIHIFAWRQSYLSRWSAEPLHTHTRFTTAAGEVRL